jgi:hypothetical protein
MKYLIPLLLACVPTLQADDTEAMNKPMPAPAPVDEATVAHQGYPAARYESLWTHSPFAVETPEEDTTESADYALVGIAQIDGVSYASLIEKQNQNHLLISSDKPINGLTLNSISHKAGGDTYATLIHDGQPLTLKLEALAANAGLQGGGTVNAPPMPGSMAPNSIVTPNIQMPGANIQSARPLIRIRRPIIHIPPRAQYGGAPVGQPPPPPTPAQ